MDADEAVRLRRAVTKLARSLNASATDEDLTPTQASVLGIVVARGPLQSAEVARVENLNPTMVSRVVSALVTRGLVNRSPDPADLRTVLLSVTQEGRAVNERVKDQRALAIRRTSEGLTAEQHEDLLRALPALEALSRLVAPNLEPARDGAP
jgi:DNA-binding MarR family transcriptional regulator